MWIKNFNNDWVDIEKAVLIEKTYQFSEKNYMVTAIFQSNCGVDNDSLNIALEVFATEDEAQNYMDKLINDIKSIERKKSADFRQFMGAIARV